MASGLSVSYESRRALSGNECMIAPPSRLLSHEWLTDAKYLALVAAQLLSFHYDILYGQMDCLHEFPVHYPMHITFPDQ